MVQNVDADNDKWEWHADWTLGETGFPIIGYDVNNDGRLDLIYGRGHSYGLVLAGTEGGPQVGKSTRLTNRSHRFMC